MRPPCTPVAHKEVLQDLCEVHVCMLSEQSLNRPEIHRFFDDVEVIKELKKNGGSELMSDSDASDCPVGVQTHRSVKLHRIDRLQEWPCVSHAHDIIHQV